MLIIVRFVCLCFQLVFLSVNIFESKDCKLFFESVKKFDAEIRILNIIQMAMR